MKKLEKKMWRDLFAFGNIKMLLKENHELRKLRFKNNERKT